MNQCHFCEKEVDEDMMCYGCGEFVCHGCEAAYSVAEALGGDHEVDDHQVEYDEDE